MDFNKVISMAAHNKQYSSYVTPAKRYSTDLPAPKKPPKSNVQSDAVKAFLAKKEQEEKVKMKEFERKKQDLLELRSIAKHNRKATAMAKRTKDNNFMANFSFMEELMKNGGNLNASMLPSSYQRCAIGDRLPSSINKKSREQRDRSPPYRGSGNERNGTDPSRPKNSENSIRSSTAVKPNDKKGAPVRKPPPPQNGLNFHELLKLAATKQHEPVEVLKPKKTIKDVDYQGRLMTNDEKRNFIEEQTRKQGRSLADVTLPTTSRRRKKFRKDADESDDLVVSNLSANKNPQPAVLKNKVSNGEKHSQMSRQQSGESRKSSALPARGRQSEPSARPQATVYRDSREREQRQPIPKQSISTVVRNGQKPIHASVQNHGQPSASKKNYPTKQVQDTQRQPKANPPTGGMLSSKTVRDERAKLPVREERTKLPVREERTKLPVRMSNGQANGKCAPSAKLPSERLPQNRATNGQVQSKRDPNVTRQPSLQSNEMARKLANKEPLSRQLPAKTSMGKQPISRSLPPKQGPSRELPKQFPSRELPKKIPPKELPKQLPPRMLPKQFPPRDLLQKQFPPRDLMPKQFPPKDLMPKQFPPRDLMPRQFPPSDLRRLPVKAVKRRIESDDEYDEEMEDFIDDEPMDGENMDISEQIKEIFGYDRNKYRYEPEDDLDIMESTFAQQMKEEALSTKMGILEDLEDIRREQEELKGKLKNAKKKKK